VSQVYEFSSVRDTYSVTLQGVLRVVKSFLPKLLITPTSSNQTVVLDNKHVYGTQYHIANVSTQYPISVRDDTGFVTLFTIDPKSAIIVIYATHNQWEIIGNTASAYGNTFMAMNASGVTVITGQPLSQNNSGNECIIASADSIDTRCYGLALNQMNPGDVDRVAFAGPVLRTDWTDIVGTVFLLAGARYFLSTIPGKLTNIPVNSSGKLLQLVGKALSGTELLITIGEPILRS